MADLRSRLKAALADRYAIEREVGNGGMVTVYLVKDLKLHREVVLKVLTPELASALGLNVSCERATSRRSSPHTLYDCHS